MRCNGCENEINGKPEDHYDRSPNCKIWIDLMNDETNVANIAKTIQDVYIEQTQHSLTCDNCEATYSNLGNINKHYKNHPECLKINLFNNIKKKSKADEKRHCTEYGCTLSNNITPKEYYDKWPESVYNKDLAYAKDAILDYIKEPRKVSSKKECIVFDLDETLIFGDPSDTMGIREMELGTSSEGHSIFALPIIKEIVEVARYSKSIGLHVVVMSARPKESYTASVTNLNMFGVEYDELIHDKDDELASEYKPKNFEILSKKYDIICTVGDKETDCYLNSPFSVKLPDPDSMKVKIYSKKIEKKEVTKDEVVKEVPKEVPKPTELGTYVFDKCLPYAELPAIEGSNEIKHNIYTTSTYSDINHVQESYITLQQEYEKTLFTDEFYLDQSCITKTSSQDYSNGMWIFGEDTSSEITRETPALNKIFMTSDIPGLITNGISKGISKTNKIIDKTQWPSGEWIDEPDYLEWRDEITGYLCIIKRVELIPEFTEMTPEENAMIDNYINESKIEYDKRINEFLSLDRLESEGK